MRITEFTRRDIVDFIVLENVLHSGRLKLIEFLKRTWDLTNMPSTDTRFKNAEDDIWQHMVNNSDWDDEYLLWTYLGLGSCDDELFLSFLENCLHPAFVSDEKRCAEFLAFINEKLKLDGYQLQKKTVISGRPVYQATDIGIKGGVSPVIGQDFWTAYLAYLQELTEKNYFCNSFPGACSDGHPVGRDDKQIELLLQKEFGRIFWPIPPDTVPETEMVLGLIEFFFRNVAKPTDSWFHSYCGNSHPTEFDVSIGRYQYTVEVNKMLTRFKHPFKLQKGKIIRTSSAVLDTAMGGEICTGDNHLDQLIKTSIEAFYDVSGTRKPEALRNIVDAFERIKTLEGSDKKKSVETVLSKISATEEIRTHFETHLRKMTEIANNFTIRHHERGKTELDDPDLVEYLFYSYYNLVRYVMSKYGFISDPGKGGAGMTVGE